MCMNLKPNKDKILTFNTTTMTSFRFITSPNILGPPPPNYLLFIFRSPLELGGSATTVFPAFKSTSHFLPQSTVSHRSNSSSEANSSCCHRSDA